MWRGLTVAFFSLLVLLNTAGCADKPPATIENRSVAAVEEVPEIRQVTGVGYDYGDQLRAGLDYVVQPGDTLYAVAFRLGMDYRTLADINNIDPPYVIKISQVLRTSAPRDESGGDVSTPSAPTAPEPPATQTIAKAASSVSTKPSTGVNESPAPQPPTAKPASGNNVSANAPVDRWSWPADGEVSRSFSESLHKGIDVSGERGAPVRATAPGMVVYAGTGVTGYGALLIVKHNDTYLSAYGHNDALLAGEGEQVSAGQVIAKMGSTSADSVKLHFEIRRNGVPINPATLLPRR